MLVSIFIVVDFPAPFGQMKPNNLPGFISNERSLTATHLPFRVDQRAQATAQTSWFVLDAEGIIRPEYCDDGHIGSHMGGVWTARVSKGLKN